MLLSLLCFFYLNQNLGGLRFGTDADGNYGYIKDGADTVTPFSSGKIILVASGLKIVLNTTTYTYDIKLLTDQWESLTIDNFYGIPWARGQEVVNTGTPAYPGKMLSYNATTGILTHTTYRGGLAHTNIETGYTDIYLIDCVLE